MFRAIIIALVGVTGLSAGAVQAGGSCSVKGKSSHVYHQPHHVHKVYVKPVHVHPIYVEPVKYCYYKVFYKQPCWDYQKHLTFDNPLEAKQMAQMLYDNGYHVALTKYEGLTYDKVGLDKIGGKIGGSKFENVKLQGQILFQGEGKIGKAQGSPEALSIDAPLRNNSQTANSPLVLEGIE